MGLVFLTAGAAYYFLQPHAETRSHNDRGRFIEGEKREASTTAGQSAPEPDRDSEQQITASGFNGGGGSWGQPPSAIDAVCNPFFSFWNYL